jgi:predicted nucleotidyltransferase
VTSTASNAQPLSAADFDVKTWIRYWRRALWLAALLRFVPFVRMVGLNGSMVTGTFTAGSDIDLYIVVKDRHIFLGRFLVTALIQLTGLKIKPGKEAGRFCPNRFAVESYVEITPHDHYHARVFHNLIPLFAEAAVYERYRAANAWMEELDHALPAHRAILRHTCISKRMQRLFELVCASPRLEQWVAAWQRARVEQDPRAADPRSKVIITDEELRFHLAKD